MAAARYQLGHLRAARGQRAEAIAAYERALALAPEQEPQVRQASDALR